MMAVVLQVEEINSVESNSLATEKQALIKLSARESFENFFSNPDYRVKSAYHWQTLW